MGKVLGWLFVIVIAVAVVWLLTGAFNTVLVALGCREITMGVTLAIIFIALVFKWLLT